jgi:hypothetical protein
VNAPDTIASRLIGSLFVDRGLVSESQIRVALEIQRETGEQLGQILVQRFGVSRKELARVVAEQWRDMGRGASESQNAPSDSWRPLGEIFVTRGFISEEELDGALKRQRKTGERLGEALVALGVISRFELAGALAEQMASLGEPDDEVADEKHATVHQLPDRSNVDGELPYGALTEETTFVEPVQEPDAPIAVGDGFAWESTAIEKLFEAPAVEAAAEAVEPSLEPVDEHETEVAAPVELQAPVDLRPEQVYEPQAEPWFEPAPEGPVEVVAEALVEPVAEPWFESAPKGPVEVVAEALVEPAAEPWLESAPEGPVEVAAEALVEPAAEPWLESAPEGPVEVAAEALVEPAAEPEPDPPADPEQAPGDDDLHRHHPEPGDTLSAGPWHLLVAAQEPGLGVSVAFAPTCVGYRLVPLSDVPSVGETVDVPGVGAQVVLRLGRSPLPGDIRVCVFVEEHVAQGGQADSAS